MSDDRNEAMRPNMNDRSEREFMGRMESNHAKLTEFSQTVESFTQDYQRLYATYTSYRDMLREVLAERDQLRAEVERLRVDAERYRWLKAYDQNSEDMGICKWVDEGWSGQWVIEHDPDTAIDHARTTHKDEG